MKAIGCIHESLMIECWMKLPSSDGDHVIIRRHEKLSSMAHNSWSVGWALRLDAHPWILDLVRMQSEDERFARAKVSLATAVRILGVALPPVGGAVGAEHLKQTRNWIDERRLKMLEIDDVTSPHVVLTIMMVGSWRSTRAKKVVILQPCSSLV